jgi:hypothetical protein
MLSTVTVRYYYLNNNGVSSPPMFQANWAHVQPSGGGAQSQISFTGANSAYSPATAHADTYEEFSFPGSNTLNAGDEAVFEFQLTSANQNMSWNQTPSWSFNASLSQNNQNPTAASVWDQVAILVGGNVVCGNLPQ